jgi:hypothetical protein
MKGFNMGEKLIRYINYINDESGFKGKVKLATITKIPSTRASMEPDSPENIELFKKAVEEITGKTAPNF